MTYSDIRARARENLRGHWGVSVAAAFVAAIFGAIIVSSGNLVQITEKIAEEAPPRISAILILLISGASALEFHLHLFALHQYSHLQPGL